MESQRDPGKLDTHPIPTSLCLMLQLLLSALQPRGALSELLTPPPASAQKLSRALSPLTASVTTYFP